VVLNPHGGVAIDWDTSLGHAHYCVWKPGLHRSNFAYARVDFWHEALYLDCWDAHCKERRRLWWPLHEYSLPPELCGHQKLFQRPPEVGADTEEMLVFADGSPAPFPGASDGGADTEEMLVLADGSSAEATLVAAPRV
jgi:hypothetical protein